MGGHGVNLKLRQHAFARTGQEEHGQRQMHASDARRHHHIPAPLAGGTGNSKVELPAPHC
jgi:hypothetical protein